MDVNVHIEDITLEDMDMALEILQAIKTVVPKQETVFLRGLNVAETIIYSVRNPFVVKRTINED